MEADGPLVLSWADEKKSPTYSRAGQSGAKTVYKQKGVVMAHAEAQTEKVEDLLAECVTGICKGANLGLAGSDGLGQRLLSLAVDKLAKVERPCTLSVMKRTASGSGRERQLFEVADLIVLVSMDKIPASEGPMRATRDSLSGSLDPESRCAWQTSHGC